MIDARFLDVLRKLSTELKGTDVNWAIGGSLGLALRGAPFHPHDIDILTDRVGAYAIQRIFSDCVTREVSFRTSETVRSHFGALDIDGVKVEIIGDFQARRPNEDWGDPPDIKALGRTIRFGDLDLPVLPLEWERQSYSRLGREDRAAAISEFLSKSPPGVS